ncbi:MAG: Maf family protein, partial [bacterium]|nr:Maf family protein [bacterium]
RAAALKTAFAKAADVAAALALGDQDFPFPGSESPASNLQPPAPSLQSSASGLVVLGADTMVVVDDRIFCKPADRADAARILRELSGRTHTVVTGLALVRPGGEALVDAAEAGVTFHVLPEALIKEYLATGQADDKAGAYGIQGLSARFVARVDGDLTGVIGLPLGRLREMFAELTGEDLYAGRSPREVAFAAFPDLRLLPEACLSGIPA